MKNLKTISRLVALSLVAATPINANEGPQSMNTTELQGARHRRSHD